AHLARRSLSGREPRHHEPCPQSSCETRFAGPRASTACLEEERQVRPAHRQETTSDSRRTAPTAAISCQRVQSNARPAIAVPELELPRLEPAGRRPGLGWPY